MRLTPPVGRILPTFASLLAVALPVRLMAQSEGPQVSPPAGAAVQKPAPVAPQPTPSGEKILVPAGTRLGVVLENGISTRDAKPGDSVYMHTSFPITQNNRVVIPIGSYIQGEILESKRPGRIKGKGELRMRLDRLILPNGYTVSMNAAPRSADTGGKETMDSEGKVSSSGGKGVDTPTIIQTTAETTGVGTAIGAISGGGKGAAIGAGVGALAGIGAILLTRGPDAHIPRGSTLDLVLEHDVALDSGMVQFTNLGQAQPITPPPPPQP
jgi:type IV secretion system protein VirB10